MTFTSEASQPGRSVTVGGVTVLAPLNVPSELAFHASQMYARNVTTLIQHLVQREKGADGKPTGPPKLVIDPADEITKEILVTNGGDVVHPRLREAVRA